MTWKSTERIMSILIQSINTSQHESDTNQHESIRVQHESTQINTSPTRVNTNQHESKISLDHKK